MTVRLDDLLQTSSSAVTRMGFLGPDSCEQSMDCWFVEFLSIVRALLHVDPTTQSRAGQHADARGVQIATHSAGGIHMDRVRSAKTAIDLAVDDDGFRTDAAENAAMGPDDDAAVVNDRAIHCAVHQQVAIGVERAATVHDGRRARAIRSYGASRRRARSSARRRLPAAPGHQARRAAALRAAGFPVSRSAAALTAFTFAPPLIEAPSRIVIEGQWIVPRTVADACTITDTSA
jgi:hypothetical protein